MGIINLRQIKKPEGTLTGRCIAIAGTISALISLVSVFVLLLIGIGLSLPAFLPRSSAKNIIKSAASAGEWIGC